MPNSVIFMIVGAVFGVNLAYGSPMDKRQYGLAQTQFINASRPDFSPVKLEVLTKSGQRNNTAPSLYGLIFEDITHSGDGGLYGEMIRNRAFQGSEVTTGVAEGYVGLSILASENPVVPYGPVLNGYRPVGNVKLSLDVLHPLSGALPTVLQLDIPYTATGEVGFLNDGWWGINVIPQTYNVSFYIMPSGVRNNGTLTHISVSLRSNLTREVWSTSSIPIGANLSTVNYTKFETQLHNTVMAPGANSTFAMTFDASEVAGSTFFVSLISLSGETFKGRQNGLRKDLADILYEAKPKFLRFPGGNNLEGRSLKTHWKWYETIGDLRDRPGRIGVWGYYNTDGLGLLEYLEWCEDMELEPILDIYAGASLDQFSLNSTNSIAEDQMQSVLQEALDELEYITGDTSTPWGALRAQHGHFEPFQIRFVEIGNEDFFTNTYDYRFRFMYDGLKKAYPSITFITSYYDENPLEYSPNISVPLPPRSMYDFHHYDEPSWFLEKFNQWDNWQEATNNPNVTIFIGEYQCISIDTLDGVATFSSPPNQKIAFPELFSAIAEGVYQIGAERNPNVVRMMALAPVLANFNNYASSPNTIAFTANDTVASASYWQWWLFGNYRGTQTLPVMNTVGNLNPLWWVALIDEPSNAVYLKIINSGTNTVSLSVDIDVPYTNVNGTILTSPNPNDYNFFNNKTAVYPRAASLPASSESFQWDVPPLSSTVLQFNM